MPTHRRLLLRSRKTSFCLSSPSLSLCHTALPGLAFCLFVSVFLCFNCFCSSIISSMRTLSPTSWLYGWVPMKQPLVGRMCQSWQCQFCPWSSFGSGMSSRVNVASRPICTHPLFIWHGHFWHSIYPPAFPLMLSKCIGVGDVTIMHRSSPVVYAHLSCFECKPNEGSNEQHTRSKQAETVLLINRWGLYYRSKLGEEIYHF